jgi:Cu/Ag efflux pump CusA
VSLEETIERGSLERLSPVLMTALCAGLALIPLVLAGNQPGNEIQAPMGVVILGGLLSSTLLNMFVVPTIYARFPTAGRAHSHDGRARTSGERDGLAAGAGF